MKLLRYVTTVLLLAALLVPAVVSAADKTTKYRVYQNDIILMEFSDAAQAIRYAGQWTHSHVEQIGTRQWIWDNYPRYRVYQLGHTSPQWEFATYGQAQAFASQYASASIRDLQSGGWLWNNYPMYRLYQGEHTYPGWEFASLEVAMREGRQWADAYIVDLRTNRPVWSNDSAQRKEELRNGPAIYRVYQGNATKPEWNFAYLQDAMAEAGQWADSAVVNIAQNGRIVYLNAKGYQVLQHGKTIASYFHPMDAIEFARLWDHAEIATGNRQIVWSNYPFYQVYQYEHLIGEFSTIPQALALAVQFNDASVRTYHQEMIWDNYRKLQFWAWNGSSSASVIRNQVSPTVGLDVVSPSWFKLKDAAGGLTDTSTRDTVNWLQQNGHAVHPLVANEFNNSAMTSRFLADKTAQAKFIESIVQRAVELKVEGINIDFEEISSRDRTNFTEFVRSFAKALRDQGLIVSIDLPRGSLSWNHLTAFDHEALAEIVDYIITMAYDQHWSSGPSAGSVSGLSWAEQGVVEFLSYGIARDKLLLGIPFYVREWKIDAAGKLISNRALLMKDVDELVRSKNATLTWDARFAQYKAEYKQDGYTHVFWIENEQTVQARLDIAKKYDLAGVAAWRLGYEPAELWPFMLRQK